MLTLARFTAALGIAGLVYLATFVVWLEQNRDGIRPIFPYIGLALIGVYGFRKGYSDHEKSLKSAASIVWIVYGTTAIGAVVVLREFWPFFWFSLVIHPWWWFVLAAIASLPTLAQIGWLMSTWSDRRYAKRHKGGNQS